MSAILHDAYCHRCGTIEVDTWCEGGVIPACPVCGDERTWRPFVPKTDIWGGPKFIRSLDQEFATVSDFRKHCRENHLGPAPSADKHHGARNEYEKLGKLYSGGGLKKRSGYDKNYGTREGTREK